MIRRLRRWTQIFSSDVEKTSEPVPELNTKSHLTPPSTSRAKSALICVICGLLTSTANALEDDGVRVSVLGYHVFSSTKKASSMRIPTSKFRTQMEALKASGVPIISLKQFLAWRSNEDTLPPQCFLITMDDGWKSVYTEAYPILKELQIPFTIYLYKNYVGSHRGGRALSYEMIQEMLDSGLCTIGSHSVSHPRPSLVKRAAKKGPEHFDKYLRNELGESQNFLQQTFKVPVTTYAYPGGFHTPEMHTLADEFGYDHLFTVLPGKVRRDSPAHTLPRYIVLGNHDGAFNASLIFRNTTRASESAPVIETPHPVTPGSGHLISSRLPTISADLSAIENLDPESLSMKVGGFGKVPAVFNPNTKVLSWTVNRPLRQPVCETLVEWKLVGKKKAENPMRWNFRIDHEANYYPN